MSIQAPDDTCCPPTSTKALSAESARLIAPMFKALGDPVRLRLVSLIAGHPGGETCVCDISPTFDVSQPTISHHLKVLREATILESERRGTWVYYRINPIALQNLSAVLAFESSASVSGSSCGDAQ